MSRSLRTLMFMLMVAVAACSGRDRAPPRNLDNACSILNEKKHFKRAFKATERRWGVPVHVQMATIYHESRFDGDARTPLRFVLGVIPMGRQSSAYGYSQALDGTWKEYVRDAGRRRASRDDIRDATDFMGWYMTRTRDRTGVPVTDARNQYLAYHEGQTGYLRGTYNSKPWLLRVADELEARSIMYELQLRQCGVR